MERNMTDRGFLLLLVLGATILSGGRLYEHQVLGLFSLVVAPAVLVAAVLLRKPPATVADGSPDVPDVETEPAEIPAWVEAACALKRLGNMLRLGAAACIVGALVAGGDMALVLVAVTALLGLAHEFMVRRPLRNLVRTHSR